MWWRQREELDKKTRVLGLKQQQNCKAEAGKTAEKPAAAADGSKHLVLPGDCLAFICCSESGRHPILTCVPEA